MIARADELSRVYSCWLFGPGEYSGYFPSPDLGRESFYLNSDQLAWNLGLLHGLSFVSAYPHALESERFLSLERVARVTGDSRVLGLMNVRWVLAHSGFRIHSPRLPLVRGGGVSVHENLDWLPRAYMVGRVRHMENAEAVRRRMVEADFDPREEAVVEGRSGVVEELSTGRPGQAEITVYSRRRVVVEVESAGRAMLVLTDADYPGWSARVDGRAVEIERVNSLFRGVRVGAGRQRVAFDYIDVPFRIGATLALVTLAFLLVRALRGTGVERARRAAPGG